jgi:insulysin
MPIVPHRHQRLDTGEDPACEYDDGSDSHSLSGLTQDAGRSANPRRAAWRVKPKAYVVPCDATGRNLRRTCMFLVVVAVVVLGTSVASFWKQASSASQLPGHIVKSASDPREYGSVHLPNGLQAILISDGKADRAAAALAVGVGSYADPRGSLGLAHFLEHMLFMGSSKYPEENEYGAFLARHGGTSNAYTAAEITNYFFAVMPDYFDGALDRFSRFFIDPLLSPAAIAREKNAVDSEYRNDLSNDGWREEIAIRYSGNPESPFSQFNIGSLRPSPTGYPATLANVSRADLVQFHAQHYHASNMRLVVLGRESLAQLTTMVEAKFSAVPNGTPDRQTANDILLPRSLAPSLPATRTADSRPRSPHSLDNQRTQKEGEARWPPPFARAQRARAMMWLPQKQRRSLTLMWPLPPQRKLFKKKAPQFVASLLGDQGHGSVIAQLRKLQLAQVSCPLSCACVCMPSVCCVLLSMLVSMLLLCMYCIMLVCMYACCTLCGV